MMGPLDAVPLPVFFVATVAIVLLCIEGGFQLGRRRRRSAEDEKEAPVGAIVAATLGLLGFLLAFTYGLVATRFDAGRKIIVEEANIIGTAYLRAGLLPDARRDRVRALLRDYVDARLRARETGEVEPVLRQSTRTHSALWAEAEAVGREQPDSISAGLFILSVNDTIDMHSTRVLVSLQNRLPLVLWIALLGVMVLTMTGVGYQCGLSRSRRSPAIGVLVISFSALLYIVADMDRPREGLIAIGTGAMEDVRRMMDAAP
jgi:hypothetical protein